ncbi:MAG: hypothetical protein ACRDSJ_17185 [Rubrobacteraceae bacterium]
MSNAASDYQARFSSELSNISREMKRRGHPTPLGDPLSGVMVLLEGPAGPRALDAISRSLKAVDLPNAYVTFTQTSLLERELLLTEPRILAAVGPEAAAEIDALQLPLASQPFSKASESIPFAWKRHAAGLLLPSLAPALEDETEKRRFWRAFLTLRTLA